MEDPAVVDEVCGVGHKGKPDPVPRVIEVRPEPVVPARLLAMHDLVNGGGGGERASSGSQMGSDSESPEQITVKGVARENSLENRLEKGVRFPKLGVGGGEGGRWGIG